MTSETPTLASAGILVRADGQMLLAKHAAGPFAGRWSMPLVGVAPSETAEEALGRMLRDVLHVQPGPVEFLDTIAAEGSDGSHFVLNAFTCIDWQGEPALGRAPGPYAEAVWARPVEVGVLDLVPEVRDWIAASAAATGRPATRTFGATGIGRALSDARGDLIAAYDAIPVAARREHFDGVIALDLLAQAADEEVYALNETRRCLDVPGRIWRPFNEAQWGDLVAPRADDSEGAVRARLQAARGATHAWLTATNADALGAWVNHETRGLVQAGACIEAIGERDREAAARLRAASTNHAR